MDFNLINGQFFIHIYLCELDLNVIYLAALKLATEINLAKYSLKSILC